MKTLKEVYLEWAKREGGKIGVSIANLSELGAHLSDMMLETFPDVSDLLLKNAQRRKRMRERKKRARSK
jgi:hypothetical protein